MVTRWIVVLFAMLLMVPAGVSAQASPESMAQYLPSVDVLGDGWTVTDTMEGVQSVTGLYRASSTYIGPAGSRLFVSLYRLSPYLSKQALEWERLRSYFQEFGERYAGADKENPLAPAWSIGPTLPLGITEAFWFHFDERTNFWLQPAIISLLSFEQTYVGFVFLEGMLDGLSNYDAAFHVAGLILEHPLP